MKELAIRRLNEEIIDLYQDWKKTLATFNEKTSLNNLPTPKKIIGGFILITLFAHVIESNLANIVVILAVVSFLFGPGRATLLDYWHYRKSRSEYLKKRNALLEEIEMIE